MRSQLSLNLTGLFGDGCSADMRRQAGQFYPAPIPSEVS